ncbi:MAG: prepilin-type N-terminal cleavage/methylation domain-containing protein [Halobacteriovoraceae bacterium]|nr:prepilin-type N-terminal cleavage/methylation domain-containing protein [Halobacteriovoraceae bacterium]
MTPISLAQTSKRFNTTRRVLLQNSSGFSLIEILIAFLLVALLFISIDIGIQSEHDKLIIAIDDIERAIKFARNEAILRNKIVRLKFNFTKTPCEYTVESSSHGELIIPEYQEEDKLDIQSREEYEKSRDVFEKAFIPVEEFKKNTRELDEDIKIVGIATSLTKDFQTSEASIYFYPSGFQDQSLIVVSTIEEVVIMTLESFRERVQTKFEQLKELNYDEYENYIYEKAEEIYNDWIDNT